MKNKNLYIRKCLLPAILALLVVVSPIGAQEPTSSSSIKPQRDTPLALMRTFLISSWDAENASQVSIRQALSCLDLGHLKQEELDKVGWQLAIQLEEIIDNLDPNGIELSSLQDAANANSIEFYEGKITGGKIILKKQHNGLWLVDGQTVKSIKNMHDALMESLEKQKAAPDKEEETASGTEVQPVDPSRSTPRATMMTFLNSMSAEPADYQGAVACLDLSGILVQAHEAEGPRKADLLLWCMNHLELVVPQTHQES